jgi:DNA modification methylase
LADLHQRGIIGHPNGKNPGDVWRIASSNFRGAHHATFPVELARRAILAGCPAAGIVLDPFMGAGTTAVAAEQLGRDWLGIELNPDFKALSDQRLHAERAMRTSDQARAA